MGIRNCIHLLTADSPRVEEVEQHQFVLRPGLSQGLFHFRFPGNCVCHDRSSRRIISLDYLCS